MSRKESEDGGKGCVEKVRILKLVAWDIRARTESAITRESCAGRLGLGVRIERLAPPGKPLK